MSKDIGRLETDALFLGLTRPAMLLGVTYSWLMLSGLMTLLWFINATSSGKGYAFLIFGVMHLIGLLIFANEPRFIEVVRAWMRASSRCINRGYHANTSSFDVY